MGSSLLGRTYGQLGAGAPVAVSLVAILMGLNLLEVVPLRLPSLDVDVRQLSAPPLVQVQRVPSMLTVPSVSGSAIRCYVLCLCRHIAPVR